MSVDIEGAKVFEKKVRFIKDCRHAHVVECYGMTVTSQSRGALRIGIVKLLLAGTYFAPDARLANSFDNNGKGLRRTLILNRVTCGTIGAQTSLISAQVNSLGRQMTFARQTQQMYYKEMQRLLRKPENREAPSGFQSVSGHDLPPGTREPETELIIYDNYQAFPAILVTVNVPEAAQPLLKDESLASTRVCVECLFFQGHWGQVPYGATRRAPKGRPTAA
jgi:hypothetical protein